MKKLLLLLLLLILPTFITAQELDAKVVINVEQLETRSKARLNNFALAVQDYLNSNRFSGDAWEFEPIKCTFNIFFTGGTETQFSAQAVVSSQRRVGETQKESLMLSILDSEWKFPYEEGQSMYFNQSDFDPFLSFLDYYAYVILGFDADSYDLNGGDEYFAKALELAVRGSNSTFKSGWEMKSGSYDRRSIMEDIHNANFTQFREDYLDYHWNGIDIFASDKKLAQKNIAKLATNLYNMGDRISPRSVLLKTFFKAKSGEIVDYLKDFPDHSIWDKLIKLDRQNTSKYQEVQDSFEE